MKNNVIDTLSREKLAQLGREYMLAAQFNSRTGYAALRISHGDEAYLDIAIDNWMAASPIYTQRMQQAMHLTQGSDIATILKGMQLECGLSHQYFDAGFKVVSDTEGHFWLNSCGPLLETEPRGEEAVRMMCHDIEDPTFDATAIATNPRARVRPLHRPPRIPADRVPHCKWKVIIEPDAEPLQKPEITGVMADSALARLEIERAQNLEEGGLDYYQGPVFETLDLERFSQSALVVICKELAVQIHLLINSLSLAVAGRYGAKAAEAVAEFQMIGGAWVISERLAQWLGRTSGGIDAIIEVMQIHPAFQPREYVDLDITKLGDSKAKIILKPSPVLEEEKSLGWHSLTRKGKIDGLQAMVRGVDKRARISTIEGEALAWTVSIDQNVQSDEEPLPVQIAKGTILYTTRLENHVQLLKI